MGSINAENKEAVAKHITATEILATLIAPKKRTNVKLQLHQHQEGVVYLFLLILFICFLKVKRKKVQQRQ